VWFELGRRRWVGPVSFPFQLTTRAMTHNSKRKDSIVTSLMQIEDYYDHFACNL
jgi:hypothetical protein